MTLNHCFQYWHHLVMGSPLSYWKATQNVMPVEFLIVLARLSDVAGVAIIVSSCGYSTSDSPIVR
jgi:hypothetical protein